MIFRALRESVQTYSFSYFLQDLKAGLMVGVVALPLSLALAVAVNVPPQNGLYTAIAAGITAALFGGSRFQVTGPTAAFVVVLLPIVHRFGFPGLLYAGFLAGLILCLFSLLKLGRFIRVIPFPVTTGFTLGIGVVLMTLQTKDLLGLDVTLPKEYVSKLVALLTGLPTFKLTDLSIGLATLAILVLAMRFLKRTPAPVIGLFGSVALMEVVQRFFPTFQVATIASRYSYQLDGVTYPGIPAGLPSFVPFWHQFTDLQNAWQVTIDILPSALTIAILAAIESLLSALVADTMTQTRHDPDGELLGQGIGNLVAPFFGGIPACGAIARTATSIRFGAISPIAAVVHGLAILGCLEFAAPLAGKIPMASLAALLLVVAFHMIDLKHVRTVMHSGSREDKIVFACCFALTVLFDMTVGVTVGVLLAALLFVNRVSQLSGGKWSLLEAGQASGPSDFPPYVQLYEIEGPLFFGAAERAIASLHQISNDVKAVIIDLKNVPMIDVTGLTALESSIRILAGRKHLCVACHVTPEVTKKVLPFIKHAHLDAYLRIAATRQDALREIEKWLKEPS